MYLPYLLFSILLSLCFFCRPSAEDLAINYYSTNPGILNFIKTFYLKEGSRYFSFPMVTLICHSRFMLDHYWILPFILMLLFWFVLRSSLKFFMDLAGISLPDSRVYWISTMFFLAFCSVIFEMSSFFYWMSGSITYMPSFILFILLLKILANELIGKHAKMIQLFAAVLLVVCISGSNEIALYFLILFLIWMLGLSYSVKRKTGKVLIASLLTSLFCVIFLILPSGVSQRAGHFRLNFPIFQASVVSAGYSARIIFRAISSPFSWITMIVAVLAGLHTKETIKEKLKGKKLMEPKLLFALICGSVLFFYFVIYLFSGELLAPRAHNLIMVFVFSALLFCGYSYGLHLKNAFRLSENSLVCQTVPLCIVLLMISSSFVRETIYNSFTGIIYNKVMEGRLDTIHAALQENRHSAVLHPYSEDFAGVGKKILPPFFHGILRKKMMNYPDWMHFQDPVQDTALYIHYYAEYYRIDTIRYLGADYERIGLINNLNQK